jgi:chromosome partitioning protein
MKIISIINYKGGVGKTTLTANLAADLGHRGYRVLAVDLDPQVNLTFSFISEDIWFSKYKEDKTIKALFDSFIYKQAQEPKLVDLIISPQKINEATKNKVDLICSHLGLINVDLDLAVMLGGSVPRQQRKNYLEVYSLLANKLRTKTLSERYDVILIDCPPNFNIVTKNAVVASDYYLIPARPDFLSTLGIRELKSNVQQMAIEYNQYVETPGGLGRFKVIKPEMLGVIFTMVGIRGGEVFSAERQYITDIEKNLGFPVFDTKIRENKTLYGVAPQYGLPVVLKKESGDTFANVRQELLNMTSEFIRKVDL